MGRIRLGKKFYIIVFLIVFSILIVIFLPLTNALVFESVKSGKVIAFIPMNRGSDFKIKYTHSIHLSDVIESYAITEKRDIMQYELEYEDFAIGMPSNAEGDETFEQADGKYYIKNMSRQFPFIDLRIGKVKANHKVIYAEKEIRLGDYIQPGTVVRIKNEKLSYFKQVKGVNIID
ncbi:DUF1850 domain-containing protein [Cytobacillus horneckiae]|uniref:DUF1850 domain-containing protein n=1 Tax=Cytobacillus horneckiae TaxID=549687 RepID=UPI00203C74A8|nr:DUF1850 domain-containing protein [Cytobacillus horneckiae]MCM3178561.1 DUF1850 domain-containing protein [Cytobacillus horneckiae]